ncbi:sugar ABC transporter substrate-binding protein [Tessaracoccus sp. HDW20]|uniref:ABC transporter substrate-binding protein n=1 Tax=Tessaracoccus coleopterorum TaxID=2714950 RepID=UPI0018D3976F|nr:sugar ABC transporter substrate-binding protein [Tessaracoccus coleopterorum]NHB85997.1 sugar ABC transporter substrate-binding protein [Tessaracoccus coleopterorum]
MTGCSTAGNTGGSGSTEAPTGGAQVTITWATTNSPGTLAAEQKIVDAFMADNPDVKVNVDAINFADYDTKLNTSLRAGQGPDVFRVNHPNVQAWQQAGYLAPLDEAITANDVAKDKFIPGLLEVGALDGKQYTLPIDTDARAFWYNPKMLKEAGIVDAEGNAKAPETWDELVDAVAKFKDSGKFGYVYRTDSDYAMAYEAVGPYMKTADGALLTPTARPRPSPPRTRVPSPPSRCCSASRPPAPFPRRVEHERADQLLPVRRGPGRHDDRRPWARDALLKVSPDLKLGEDYALAPIPVPKAGDPSASTSGGWQIGMNAKSKQQEAAGRFLAYFEKAENLTTLASSTSFPPLIDGMEGEPFASDPFYDAFKEILPHSGLPIRPVPRWPRCRPSSRSLPAPRSTRVRTS